MQDFGVRPLNIIGRFDTSNNVSCLTPNELSVTDRGDTLIRHEQTYLYSDRTELKPLL